MASAAKYVTVVQPEWLPRLVPSMCTFGKVAESPAPYYDAERDGVRCWMGGTYGTRRWELPLTELPYPEGPDLYRYFARFLLDGTLYPALARFVPHLKNRPDIMNKKWVKERVVAVLQPLVDSAIATRAALERRWKSEPRFLLEGVALWLDSKHHVDLAACWPPL